MAKIKPLSIGLTLGVFLAVIYAVRTIVIWLFPNFVVNLARKVTNNMLLIQIPVITSDALVIGIATFFIVGLIWGAIFAWIYNWTAK